MIALPQDFIQRMKSQLGNDADAFFKSLEQPSPTSIRLHHIKGRSPYVLDENIPWCSNGFYLRSRPSFHLDPHWHGGAYYVQEASSMILDHIIRQLGLDHTPRTWLDLCAAPGGKTGILASHLGPHDVLIANEVVGQRRSILKENLVKAGYLNTIISGEPSSTFSEPIADIILIDAPCAGEGMMRKEPEAIRQWSSSLVNSCSVMQRQIVQDAARGLKKEGYLLYSTCSYSQEENIQNISHFIQSHGLHPVNIPFPIDWGIEEIQDGLAVGYQLYPHKVRGEGLFIAVLQKLNEEEKYSSRKTKKPFRSFEPLPAVISDYVRAPASLMVRKNYLPMECITVEAEEKANEVLMHLPRAMLIADAGELKGKDYVPSHVMAMSGIQAEHYEVLTLDLTQALDYLERNTNSLPEMTSPGWYLVQYERTILGWLKLTQQGWKNHFPMNWRLRDRKVSS